MNTYQSYPICDWNLLELSYVCCVLFPVLATKASILRSQELRATSNGRRTWCALISLLAKLTMQTAGSGKAPFMFDCLRFQMVFIPTICIASSGWLCLVTYMMLQAMYEENALSSYTKEIKYRSGISYRLDSAPATIHFLRGRKLQLCTNLNRPEFQAALFREKPGKMMVRPIFGCSNPKWYPPANVYITMENPAMFIRENSLFRLGHFHI